MKFTTQGFALALFENKNKTENKNENENKSVFVFYVFLHQNKQFNIALLDILWYAMNEVRSDQSIPNLID